MDCYLSAFTRVRILKVHGDVLVAVTEIIYLPPKRVVDTISCGKRGSLMHSITV
jgi:hypothetical protein